MPFDVCQPAQQIDIVVDQQVITVAANDADVRVDCVEQVIDVVTAENIVEVHEGQKGDKGDPGADGAGGILSLPAGETIHAQRAVRVAGGSLFQPDPGTVAHAMQVIGIAMQAGNALDTINVRTAGPMVEPSWSWSAGFVYCGSDGVLTQSPVATGWLLAIGRAIDATTIEIDIDTPFIRS